MRNNYIIDNHLDNELNDLSQYADKYNMEIRYKPQPKIIGVIQYDLDMNLIAEYDDFTYLPNEYQDRTIKRCCQREFDSAYGYIWRYITDTPEQYELDKQYYSTKTVAKKGYKIAQYTPDGQLVKVFDSFADVEKGGWGRNMVSLCCRGKKDIYRGYIWKYAE
jgi:hypothetical protein